MVQSERDRDWRLTQRARGPRTAPLSGAGGLDSHRQNGIFRGFGFCSFRERVSSLQPPVTRAVGLPIYFQKSY